MPYLVTEYSFLLNVCDFESSFFVGATKVFENLFFYLNNEFSKLHFSKMYRKYIASKCITILSYKNLKHFIKIKQLYFNKIFTIKVNDLLPTT